MLETITRSASVKSTWLSYKDKQLWEKYISKMPAYQRDIYFTPDYVRLYVDNDAHACCFVYQQGDHVYMYPFIMRPIPHFHDYCDICSAYGYSGPVCSTEDPQFIRQAYEVFQREAYARNTVAELIKFHPLINNHRLLSGIYQGAIKNMCDTVYVDVQIEETHRWRHVYSHANRKNINKARRQNIQFQVGTDSYLWEAFEQLYNTTMRANRALPNYYFSAEYFAALRNNCAGRYTLAACLMGEKIIAVMLVLIGYQYAHCHLIGTERSMLSTGVNNLLHHELIQWCKQQGIKLLHIGGGRTDEENDSLLRFKKNFSNLTASFYVGECVLNNDIYEQACAYWEETHSDFPLQTRLLKYRM